MVYKASILVFFASNIVPTCIAHSSCFSCPPSPPFYPLLSVVSVIHCVTTLTQHFLSLHSVSAHYSLRAWLLLLDNACPCFHCPLISGILALLVTTRGSG